MLQIPRSDSESVARALLMGFNALARDRVDNDLTFSHYDRVSEPAGSYPYPSSTALTVTASNAAVTLATVRTLGIDIHKVATAHFASDIANPYGAGAHLAADDTNALPTVITTSSSQGDVNTFLNSMKTAINAHFIESGVHAHNDVTQSITSANATDLASSITLANEIKTDLNLHINSAPVAQLIKLEG